MVVTLRATLFDMDGLLVDTEILWHEAEVEVFGALGVPLEEATTRSTKGLYIDEVVAFWHSLYPWQGPSQSQVSGRLLTRVAELVDEKGRMMPGARRAIELCAARGPIALASSTPLGLIEHILTHFELLEYFGVIRSAEFEEFGKPHPAVFVSAAGALGVEPHRCLVLEDSYAGVLAAKAGRMTVVAVPTPEDRSLPIFTLADLVLESLEQLEESWLDAAFGSTAP